MMRRPKKKKLIHETEGSFLTRIFAEYQASRVRRSVHSYPGKLFEVDGLDKSGKGTSLDAIREYLEGKGARIFMTSNYERQYNEYPPKHAWQDYDVIMVDEPSFCLTGSEIRNVIINIHNSPWFHTLSTARYYARDRNQQNKIIVIPALKAGKVVVQGRGVSTSLVYQPTQDHFWRQTHTQSPIIHFDTITRIPGNAKELTILPNTLIFTRASADVVMARIRGDKEDNARFENLTFQKVIESIYGSNEFHEFFRTAGVQVNTCETGESVGQTRENIVHLFTEFLTHHHLLGH